GLYAGLLDPAIMDQKTAAEKKLRAAVDANPEYKKKWGDAWDQIARSLTVQRQIVVRNAALNAMGSQLFGIARNLVRLADEKPKPSAERLSEYNDAKLPSLEFQMFSPAPVKVALETQRIETGLSYMAELLGGDDPLVRSALAGKSPRTRAEEVIGG